MSLFKSTIGSITGLMLSACSPAPNLLNEPVDTGALSICESDVSATGSSLTLASEKKLALLQDQLPDWLSETDVPSAAISYVEKGSVQWSLVCGHQRESEIATLQTRYNTASIAKPMVGEIVLRLVSQGRISLDEPMAQYWMDPDIAQDPRADLLTPRISLSHQTGFANWRRMTDGTLSFQWRPGTQTGYSGEGIRYVVRFIEEKLEIEFEDLAADILFTPSGMQQSSFVAELAFRDDMAWGRLANAEWVEPVYNEEPIGAGDVWITAADYARFLIAAMSGVNTNDEMVAERSAINRDEVVLWCGEGKTPLDICPAEMGFGVGWYIYKYDDHTLIAHSGSNMVDKSLALFLPQSQTGFVTLTNGENGKAVISKIARILYDNEDFYTLEGY